MLKHNLLTVAQSPTVFEADGVACYQDGSKQTVSDGSSFCHAQHIRMRTPPRRIRQDLSDAPSTKTSISSMTFRDRKVDYHSIVSRGVQ
jgi:hypothetical protein